MHTPPTDAADVAFRIDVWTDYVCPWCGIGAANLATALDAFPHRDAVVVAHHAYQLDPGADPDAVRPAADIVARKYGMSADAYLANARRIEALGRAAGFAEYHVADNVIGNTSKAHELVAHAGAGTDGQAGALHDALFAAYFGRGEPIFADDNLVAIAVGVGLDADDCREVLADRRYARYVSADSAVATRLGATGVPFVIVNGRYAIGGAQPVDTFADVIAQAWDERAAVRRGDDATHTTSAGTADGSDA